MPEITKINIEQAVENSKNSLAFLTLTTHEKDRTNASHEIFKSTWQNNFSAPVEDLLNAGGAKVLDAGCHPAAPWLMDMAKEYNNCNFFGTDILPIPEPKNKPRNLNFYQCDTLCGLPFENNTFDFVYQKILVSSFSVEDWAKAINELIRVLKPGGYLELMEFDDKFWNGGPEGDRWISYMHKMYESKGIDPYIVYRLPSMLELTGRLNNIQHEEKRFYFGMPGRIGELINFHYSGLFTSYKKPIVDFVDDLSYDDYDEMIEKVLEEFEENHTSIKTSRVYGQKI
ncbi:6276_t:CDS:2 [Funneliformis geosporum]|uniref:6406_t:CDS:1 n=1 Tax=Funneliformis geosporum TaxID=1117311 RepID=A0A9W4SHT4_9GLOM|nr:6276_t:CDS:2 [Funneliformis geosporum]CAI2169487.1 6406_t:CDS:2 [Funneliformis geosporum]